MNDHLYLDVALYRSENVGSPQPNPGTGSPFNIVGVAPYWRLAWQELTGSTQYEIGTYGMHLRNSPFAIPAGGTSDIYDDYTDFAFDTQIDRTLFRKDVLSFRATYIRENSNLAATASMLSPTTGLPLASPGGHHLNTVQSNVEFHYGNRLTGTFGWFNVNGTVDPLLYTPNSITGSVNGDPRSAGVLANVSYWPWQNLQLAAQYTA